MRLPGGNREGSGLPPCLGHITLAGATQVVGASSCPPKVCGFDSQSGCIREATNRCFSLTSMFLFLKSTNIL